MLWDGDLLLAHWRACVEKWVTLPPSWQKQWGLECKSTWAPPER